MSETLPILTVSELSVQLKTLLEFHFSHVMVQGEISGYKHHVSGHHYFALKDGQSVIDAVCWRGTTLNFPLKDGAHVMCQGRVTAYPGRSKYQIVVTHVLDQGRGALLEQLERLKHKLQTEGMFDQHRPLPKFPTHIGILTSPTGAVIQDMLHRCRERWPCRITLFPIQVQGTRVGLDVLEGLRFFHQLPLEERPEILIIARGGGSVEDLWGFQEESLVRAVASSHIPTVSAIGHETDTTLTDYAADLRAPTPTAAIELVLPHREELLKHIAQLAERMYRTYKNKIEFAEVKQHHMEHKWLAFERYPQEPLMQRLDEIWEKIERGIERFFDKKRTLFLQLSGKIHLKWTDTQLQYAQLNRWQAQLETGIKTQYKHYEERLQWLGHRLDTSSYKRVLERGFTLVQTEDGACILSAQDVASGQDVQIMWHDGFRLGRVQESVKS